MKTNLKTPENNFAIHTSVYNGPFELVLELIEKRQLLINDLALASITDDFIQHVHAQETFPVKETTHFIGIAATLLLIKSKSLLPNLALTEEETEDVEDFKQRLALYEHVRKSAHALEHTFGKTILFSRGGRMVEPIFAPSNDLSLEAMANALQKKLAERASTKEEYLPEARVRNTVSIRETMDKLTARVQNALTISFRDFSEHGKKEKVTIIVTFLALLELVKQGSVAVDQYSQHGDIRITNTISNEVPRYGL